MKSYYRSYIFLSFQACRHQYVVVLLLYWLTIHTVTLTYAQTSKPTIQTKTKTAKIDLRIDNDYPYKQTPSVLPGQRVEPVIFEPIKHIKLSRSTYEITSYLDFTPYMQSFINFETYLNRFLIDIGSRGKVGPLADFVRETPDSKAYKCETFRCRDVHQYKQIVGEVKYIQQLYQRIKSRFYAAIDQLDVTVDTVEQNTKTKRSAEQRFVQQSSKKNDKHFRMLDHLAETLNVTDHKGEPIKSRKKRAIFSMILGYGVYQNYKNIKKIKKNIEKLHLQNILQEKQIQELAGYLNLTATQVQVHQKAILELDTRLLDVEHTLGTLKREFEYTRFHTYVMTDVKNAIIRLTTGLMTLQNNMKTIYEYMRVMSSHLVNPMILPPHALREILGQIEEKMKQNPRLELPYNSEDEIWQYYDIMKVTPMVVNNVMVIILTIPLIDKSLQMNVFKVHNLPSLHPKLQIQASYQLEGEYLAIDQHGIYASLPATSDVQICMMTGGGLCMLNQALYPVEKIEWCVYALYKQQDDMIKKYCKIQTSRRDANLAVNLGGYMWAISSLVGEKLQVRCLTETHVQDIKPPLQIVEIGNGCEGYSPNINIPAKSELTAQYTPDGRSTFFLKFNAQYTNITAYGAWARLNITKLTPEQKAKLSMKLPELPPMTYEHLNKKLEELDYDYPWSVHPNILLFVIIGSTITTIVGMVLLFWKIYRLRYVSRVVTPLKKLVTEKGSDLKFKDLKNTVLSLLTPPTTDSPANPRGEDKAITIVPPRQEEPSTSYHKETQPTEILPLAVKPTVYQMKDPAMLKEIIVDISKEKDIKGYAKYLTKQLKSTSNV